MKGNAKITSTMLGYEDHGILTCMIHLTQGASGQGFGGWRLDSYSKKLKCKTDSAYAGFWMRRLLEVVGVEKWEDLKGKYIRVDGEEFGNIEGIGHIIEDKWFYPNKEEPIEEKKDA